MQELRLSGNEIAELNLTEARFDNLVGVVFDSGVFFGSFFERRSPGLRVDSDGIARLILDDAELSLGSFATIIGETTSVTTASLVGLKFFDERPSNLSAFLGIETLDNVTVDPALFSLYADEFRAFDAIDGNTVAIVPETSCVLLVLPAVVVVCWRRRKPSWPATS